VIGTLGNFGATYGKYGSHPMTPAGLYNTVTGSHVGYHGWLDYLNPFSYFADDEDAPPSYDTVTAVDTTKSTASMKVTDGDYEWILYSNGDAKIFNVPAGKESLIGTRYKIGDSSYAGVLANLRKRSSSVDTFLAQHGLDAAKLASGGSRTSAAVTPVEPPKKGLTSLFTRDSSTDLTTPTKRPPWATIGGAAIGVVGLIFLFTAIARRKRKRK